MKMPYCALNGGTSCLSTLCAQRAIVRRVVVVEERLAQRRFSCPVGLRLKKNRRAQITKVVMDDPQPPQQQQQQQPPPPDPASFEDQEDPPSYAEFAINGIYFRESCLITQRRCGILGI